ncbi:MAG: hypothetical protein RLZZ241_861 [Bacteroidota bacterium]|jgi:hypothetical protein
MQLITNYGNPLLIKIMKRLWVWLPIIGLGGCSKAEEISEQTLSGSWVEITSKQDTIAFEYIDSDPFINLKRGVVLKNGVVFPKNRSGLFTYKIQEHLIGLKYLLSSNSEWEWYYIEVNESALHIGNFYDAPLGDVLTFHKLH